MNNFQYDYWFVSQTMSEFEAKKLKSMSTCPLVMEVSSTISIREELMLIVQSDRETLEMPGFRSESVVTSISKLVVLATLYYCTHPGVVTLSVTTRPVLLRRIFICSDEKYPYHVVCVVPRNLLPLIWIACRG